jgi:hypothetical protein
MQAEDIREKKGGGKALMKRPILKVMIKMCSTAILISILVGILIGIIGNLNKWDTSIKYSNAFFIAGALVIIAGFSSRLSAGQDWKISQQLNAESFRNMSVSEQAGSIVKASNSVRLVVLGFLSGILLILASVLVTILF